MKGPKMNLNPQTSASHKRPRQAAVVSGGRRIRSSALATTSVVALLLTGCAGGTDDSAAGEGAAGEPIKLTFTSIASPGSALQDTLEWWMDEVEARSDGAVEFERFYAGALVGAVDTLSAISDGRADAAYFAPVYAPAALPLWNIAMVPNAGANTLSSMQSLRQLNDENAAFQEELEANNLKVEVFIPIGYQAQIMSPEPFMNLDELSGKRIRAAGPGATALAQVGVNPVALEGHEVYEALERGTVDGVNGIPMDAMPSLGLPEVAPWITSLGLGMWGTASFILNQSVWDDLPADVQGVMNEVSDEYYDVALEILAERETLVCEELIAEGGGAVALPEAESKEWESDLGDTLWEDWREAAQGSGASAEEIESVESQWRESNAEIAESSDFESGVEKCIQMTAGE